jgi:transposase
MPQVSRLEVIATGARRRWTLAEKRRIVAESYAVARGASATARRHGLTTSQLFAWRKLAREGRLGSVEATGFAAALVVPETCGGATTTSTAVGNGLGAGRMEISVGVARVVVDAGVDAAALARVLEVVWRRSSGATRG